MMGPQKLSAMRAQVRKSFKKSDAELLTWFNRRVEGAGQKSDGNQMNIATLRLLRNALVKEAKCAATPGNSRRVAGDPKE